VTHGAGQGTAAKLCNEGLLLKLYIGDAWSDESRLEQSRQKSLGLGWQIAKDKTEVKGCLLSANICETLVKFLTLPSIDTTRG